MDDEIAEDFKTIIGTLTIAQVVLLAGEINRLIDFIRSQSDESQQTVRPTY